MKPDSQPAGADPALRAYHDYQDADWLRGLFRPLLTALMATSLTVGPLALIRAAAGWHLNYVLPLIFLAALEGVYSTMLLSRPRFRLVHRPAFRLGEGLLLLVLLQLATWLLGSGLPAADEVAGWLTAPATFLKPQFVWVAALLALAWSIAIITTRDFQSLAIQADEFAAHQKRAWGESSSALRAFFGPQRGQLLAAFTSRWIWGGILMVFTAAASRVSLVVGPNQGLHMGIGSLGLPADVLAGLVAYFLAGLLLISEGRLALLRSRWHSEDVPVTPTVRGRWHATAGLMLLLVAAVAALLPFGSTDLVGRGIEFLIAILVRIVYTLILLLIALLALLIYPLRFLFGGGGTSPQLPEMRIPAQQEVTSRMPPWLGGALVWIILAGLLLYFGLSYLSTHSEAAGPVGRFWQQVRYWWRARWARWRGQVQAAAAAVRQLLAGRGAVTSADGGRGRLLSPGRLPPRARVRYFYLATLKRAADRGVARPAARTPLEYVEDLRRQWPEAEIDVDDLTRAFVTARYSAQPVDHGRAASVQSVWRRLMRKLRGPRHEA